MAWRARKAGTEFPVEIRRDGELLFTAWFRTPTIDEAAAIRTVGESSGGEIPYYEERLVLGILLARVDGFEREDGSPLVVAKGAANLLSHECAEYLLEFIDVLAIRALGTLKAKGVDDAKN